jgi:diacylglycerol kinase (ATP)
VKPGKTGIARLLDAARYSRRGLVAAFREEAAFRQELLLCVILFGLSFVLAANAIEWLLLVAPLLLLLIVELLNSAVETIVDRIGPEQHPLSGRAKDMGSAAVLLALLLVATAWCAVLWSHFRG